MVCALCMYDGKHDEAEPAITVIEGYAVCHDHLGVVAQGERFHGILRTIRTFI